MSERAEELRARTKQFAIRIVKLFRSLPRSEEARVVGRQVLRCGTAVAANYRGACRSRSRAEFVARMGVVVEESDETAFWLELLVDIGVVRRERMEALLHEANELLSIFAASQRTARFKERSITKSRNHQIVNSRRDYVDPQDSARL